LFKTFCFEYYYLSAPFPLDIPSQISISSAELAEVVLLNLSKDDSWT